MSIIPLNQGTPVSTSGGMMTLPFSRWQQQVSLLGIIINSGSPEGVEDAYQGRVYMDSAGVTGSILYIKRDADIAGDTKKGWVLV